MLFPIYTTDGVFNTPVFAVYILFGRRPKEGLGMLVTQVAFSITSMECVTHLTNVEYLNGNGIVDKSMHYVDFFLFSLLDFQTWFRKN